MVLYLGPKPSHLPRDEPSALGSNSFSHLFTSRSEVRDWESRKPVVDSCQPCVSLSDTDNSCKVCCRNLSGPCVPYVDAEQKNLFLRKGKPCTVGFCDMNVSIMFQLFCTVGVCPAVEFCIYREHRVWLRQPKQPWSLLLSATESESQLKHFCSLCPLSKPGNQGSCLKPTACPPACSHMEFQASSGYYQDLVSNNTSVSSPGLLSLSSVSNSSDPRTSAHFLCGHSLKAGTGQEDEKGASAFGLLLIAKSSTKHRKPSCPPCI